MITTGTDAATANVDVADDANPPGRLAEAASLARAGRFADAILLLQPVVERVPDHWPCRSALVDLYEATGARAQAIDALRAHIACDPNAGEAWLRLSGLLHRMGHAADALVAVRSAVALRPEAPQAWNLLGCLLDHDDPAAAGAFSRAVALAPEWSVPHRNLAGVLRARGEADEALAVLRDLVRRDPMDRIAWTALAETQLEHGDDAGWDAYEWRFDCGGETPMFPGTTAPIWDGRPLRGEIVMVWLEQGLGDQLQFCRYLPEIVAAGGRVWLQTPRTLRALLATQGAVERFFDEGETPAGYDLQIPLLSLPRVLRATRPSIPPAPYLRAPMALPADIASWLDAPAGTKRIGLVHASRPDHPSAMRRDCPLPLFRALADVPTVRLYDLQFGATNVGPAWLIGLGHAVGDFARTASVVEALDLVITVDTAMAHLCGALGTPVWTLLSTPCDWRWRRDRDDSPWYPSMRLYRQTRSGDWSAPLAKIAEDLAAFVAAPRGP